MSTTFSASLSRNPPDGAAVKGRKARSGVVLGYALAFAASATTWAVLFMAARRLIG